MTLATAAIWGLVVILYLFSIGMIMKATRKLFGELASACVGVFVTVTSIIYIIGNIIN